MTVNLNTLFHQLINNEIRKDSVDEEVWVSSPVYAFLYAKHIKGSRLREDLENCFLSDLPALINYIYWIRDDLKEPIPENLHNFMLLRYLEDSDGFVGEIVNQYFSKVGRIKN